MASGFPMLNEIHMHIFNGPAKEFRNTLWSVRETRSTHDSNEYSKK